MVTVPDSPSPLNTPGLSRRLSRLRVLLAAAVAVALL
ncbi:hypothetical protein SAMN05216251_1111, partial [Actinacidiphila alni]